MGGEIGQHIEVDRSRPGGGCFGVVMRRGHCSGRKRLGHGVGNIAAGLGNSKITNATIRIIARVTIPGESVRVIGKFSDNRGIYVFHCHNIEHEDMRMMDQFEVQT